VVTAALSARAFLISILILILCVSSINDAKTCAKILLFLIPRADPKSADEPMRMTLRTKILMWLYTIGVLITLLFQIDLRFANCVNPGNGHLDVFKIVAHALTWPLSWSLVITGLSARALLISMLTLVLLFAIAQALERLSSVIDTKHRLNIFLLLYAAGFLITLPYQAGTGMISCAEPGASYITVIRNAVWVSFFWPQTWAAGIAESLHQKIIPAVMLMCVALCLLVEGCHRVTTAAATHKAVADRGLPDTQPSFRCEPQVAAFALFALIVAVCVLTSLSSGMSYGNTDGKLFQSTVLTAFKFARPFEITSISPIQGVGSQLLPLNPWINPAYWPFAIFDAQLATDISGVIALGCFVISSYLMARCFDIPVLPSIVSAQLSFALFAPAVVVLGFASVFYINPGWAVVCAPHMLALGILSRVEPGPLSNLIIATGSIFLLLLFSLYCDPLWTLISGFSWAVPFSVVTLASRSSRQIIARCVVLGCCAALLFLSGVLGYEHTLSKYMARVQISELLSRRPSLAVASFLFSQPVAVFYYCMCMLGWSSGLSVLRGRGWMLVLAGAISFAFLMVYTAGFLLLPGNWWLPLPIYVEHSLFPLFTTAAVAGIWGGVRLIVPLALISKGMNGMASLQHRKGLSRRVFLFRLDV
jgi:hypothetical protein